MIQSSIPRQANVPQRTVKPRSGRRPADLAFGEIVRQRRRSVGMTQHQLAEVLGISAQQLQKYEIGVNRVALSRLFDIAAALGAGPAELVEEAEKRLRATSGAKTKAPSMAGKRIAKRAVA
jgi:transcriptional regulator with XRE-family HTH domain